MSDCCSASGGEGALAKKRACPANGRACPEVSARTIAHHIQAPWTWAPTARRYFFCADPACDVVYFGDDGSLIPRALLRTRVGVKETSADAPLCYCFGVSRADYARDPATRDFVVAQTAAGQCSCETGHPAGRCCLADFPRDRRA